MNNPDLNSDSDALLDKPMHSALEEGGYLVGGERDLYMEVVDTTTGMMWMSSSPVSEADFAALRAQDFSDEDIWDIGAISAFFAQSNRLANLSAMRPNDEFYSMAR